MCGGVLLSRWVSPAVPSALAGLASGFGMGPGVSPPPWPPQQCWSPRSPLPCRGVGGRGVWLGACEPGSGCVFSVCCVSVECLLLGVLG